MERKGCLRTRTRSVQMEQTVLQSFRVIAVLLQTYSARNLEGWSDCLGKISWRGKTTLLIFNGTLNVEEYMTMLEEYLLPFREACYTMNCVLQQSSAPGHPAKFLRQFVMEESITDLKWPPK